MSGAQCTFLVPLPPRHVSSNARVHWAQRASAVRIYRAQVGWLAQNERQRIGIGPAEGKRRVSLLFCTRGCRAVGGYAPRDEANAVDAAKGLFDGLVDAGVLTDDSKRWMELGPVSISNTRGPYVIVFVEPIG